MTLFPATLLVCHGSRDSRSQIAAERLLYLVREYQHLSHPVKPHKKDKSFYLLTKTPDNLLELGFLECTKIPLHQQIERLAKRAIAQNIPILNIFPLFLSAGVHVKEDIPSEVAIAQTNLGSKIKIIIKPYLGQSASLCNLLAQKFQQIPAQGRILLAHGSRRQGGNQPIESIASKLNAVVAYWSIQPNLEDKIRILSQKDCSSIAIMPYFLFTGGITDGINQQVQQLKLAFSHLTLSVGYPLGATPELAQLIVEEIKK